MNVMDDLDDASDRLAIARMRATRLIETGIWNGLAYSDLQAWIANFKSPDEKLLASLLLDSFTFKSQEQLAAQIKACLTSSIPYSLANRSIDILNGIDFSSVLKKKYERNLTMYLVPVIRDIDPPTKSGPSVARQFKRLECINEEYMIWPWQIRDKIASGGKIFIFIDDTLATGEQFEGFLKQYVPSSYPDEVKFSYVPLVAHTSGLRRVEKLFPRISVCPVEVATVENSFFNNHLTKNYTDLKALYDEVVKRIFNKGFYKQSRYGYGDLALTLSYNHSTPNATLPVYWYSSNNFHPLVRR
tara:strand:+ start:440 stop:1342 length:903 start_codon:yes stop_codon:yes gene_type:complete